MKPIFNLLLQFILPLSDFRAISSSLRLPNCLPTALVCMVLQYATLPQTSSGFQAVDSCGGTDLAVLDIAENANSTSQVNSVEEFIIISSIPALMYTELNFGNGLPVRPVSF